MKILVILGIMLVGILGLVIFPLHTHPDNSLSKYYNNTAENTIQPVSEAPLCVTHIENQTIDAGNLGDFSCPAPDFFTQTQILKINGFYGVYHNSTNDRSDTYVLEPRHAGTITYTIYGRAIQYEGTRPPHLVIRNQTEISNDAAYIHHQVITIPQTVRVTSTIEQNGKMVPYYWVCHNSTNGYPNGGGEECYGGPESVPPSDHVTIDAMLYSHPGIDVTFTPQSEIISHNETVTVSATISAASGAPTGTYWIILPPGQCNGGQILLVAVTKCSMN